MTTSCGEDFAAFAGRELFAPLGIRYYRWARFDRGRKVDAGGHLLLTPQAMVKLGMLVLQDGEWNGRRIVVSVCTAGYYNPNRARSVFELFFHVVLPSVEELKPYLPDRRGLDPDS